MARPGRLDVTWWMENLARVCFKPNPKGKWTPSSNGRKWMGGAIGPRSSGQDPPTSTPPETWTGGWTGAADRLANQALHGAS
ncbi:hypothetical protein VTJ04DRAFT_9141 [Mycothermus thermophilus]|uniref:uncharacterized protein n=1 Tax=Humicola insolens TaxID=85995 RepID=UPI003742326E